MIALVTYTIAAFGFAYITGFSKISLPLREGLDHKYRPAQWVLSLLECPACIGFWFGIGYSLVATGEDFINTMLRGLFTCGANFLLAKVSGLIPEE